MKGELKLPSKQELDLKLRERELPQWQSGASEHLLTVPGAFPMAH
jgi:hypothetical protein